MVGTTVPKLNVQRLTTEWQARLGILDWDITVEVVKPDVNNFAGRYGDCNVNIRKRSAVIRVLDPSASSEDHFLPTLIHELLHVVLWGITGDLPADSPLAIAEEQVIHALTKALLPDTNG